MGLGDYITKFCCTCRTVAGPLMAPSPSNRSPTEGPNGKRFMEEGPESEVDNQEAMPKLRISGEALKKLVSQVGDACHTKFDADFQRQRG